MIVRLGGIKKCFTVLFALPLAVLFIALLQSSYVNAASEFDAKYRKTDSIHLSWNTSNSDDYCSSLDITSTWSGILTGYDGSNTTFQNLRDSFQTALSGDGRWGVSQVLRDGDYSDYIYIFWTEDNTLSLDWDNDTIGFEHSLFTDKHGGGGINYAVIQPKSGAHGAQCQPDIVGGNYTGDGGVQVSTDGTDGYSDIRNLFVYTDYPNYPDGYAGEIIPDHVEVFTDYIQYKIVDKVGEFTPRDIDKSKIKKCELFIDDNPSVDNDDSLSEFVYTIDDCSSSVVHNFSDYGNYYVRLELTKNDDSVREYTEVFDVDGGTYEGIFDTDGKSDNPNNPTYEDCSVYTASLDIVGGFGCVMRNFGTWFVKTMSDLFVPSKGTMAGFFNQANNFMHQKFGFLLYPFDFIYGILSSFVSSPVNCNQPSISLPGASNSGHFFGSNFNINVCSAQSNFPVLYNVSVFMIRAFVVFVMIIAIHHKLLITLSDHSRDGRGDELWG